MYQITVDLFKNGTASIHLSKDCKEVWSNVVGIVANLDDALKILRQLPDIKDMK